MTNVDQSQVSRIFRGDFKRLSQNILILCKYANLDADAITQQNFTLPEQLEKSRPISDDGIAHVIQAFSCIWDGTLEHAHAIGKIILATRSVSDHARAVSSKNLTGGI